MLSYNVKLEFPSKATEQAMLDCLKVEADCYGYVSALLETTGFREHPMSRYAKPKAHDFSRGSMSRKSRNQLPGKSLLPKTARRRK